MKNYELNLRFSSQKECDQWERENLTDGGRRYKGGYVIMVGHETHSYDGEVILTNIMVC